MASAFFFFEREGGAAAEGFEAGCEAGTSGTGGCGVGMQPTTVLLDVSRGSVKEEEEEEEEEEGGGGVNVVGWSSGSTPGFRHSISCVEEEEEEDEAIQAGRLLCRPSKGAEQPGGDIGGGMCLDRATFCSIVSSAPSLPPPPPPPPPPSPLPSPPPPHEDAQDADDADDDEE